MQRVRITVTRRREFVAGDTFEVFGDQATGTIDFAAPLLDRRVPLWPEAVPTNGHVQDGHVSGRHLDTVDPDGHLDGLHLIDDHLWPAAPRTAETPEYMFGAFKHSVKTYDALGNVKSDTSPVLTTVINSSPTAPRDFVKDTYDAGNDQMRFSFAASDQLGL